MTNKRAGIKALSGAASPLKKVKSFMNKLDQITLIFNDFNWKGEQKIV